MLFEAAIAAAPEVQKITSGIGSLLGISNPNDPKRAAAAQAALPKAIAGSLADAQYILQQRFHSADAYGKQQFELAWQSLVAQNPAIAAQALQTGQTTNALNTSPSISSQLQSEWTQLVAKLKQDVGNTVQQIGAGVATGAATAIDPNTPRVTVPFFSGSNTWMIPLVALAIALVWFLSRKKA